MQPSVYIRRCFSCGYWSNRTITGLQGITDGTFDGMQNGIITCTGLFANMPAAAYAIERFRHRARLPGHRYQHRFGQACAIQGHPHLVDKNGEFILSTVQFKDAGPKTSTLSIRRSGAEATAQVEKFIALVGEKPRYIHTHSIGNWSPIL
jgi:predicted glycoside hydrolase/deacetylase ChbG (UPF0249 family)